MTLTSLCLALVLVRMEDDYIDQFVFSIGIGAELEDDDIDQFVFSIGIGAELEDDYTDQFVFSIGIGAELEDDDIDKFVFSIGIGAELEDDDIDQFVPHFQRVNITGDDNSGVGLIRQNGTMGKIYESQQL